MPEGYSAGELMVVCAAREVRDSEVVFVGMRLPLLAFALAKRTHAPRAIGVFENGIVRDEPAAALLYTMSDAPNIAGAQMDRFGNLNTSYIFTRSEDQAGGPPSGGTKLPGSGGAADIAALAHRLLIIIEHERRRFVPRVDYVTSPGYGEGGDWRSRVGLPRGGPSAAITTLGVLRFDPETREAYLDSYHPGGSPEEVQAHTEWDLRVSDRVRETPPPTADELRIIREHDPAGFWTH